MKKNLLLLLLLSVGIGLAACGGKQQQEPCGCTLTVKLDLTEYTRGYLKNTDYQVLDTLQIGKKMVLERTDTASMPYVALLELINPKDSIDILTMPVVVERGNVQVEIGEYITTRGTELNVRLQEFLNGLQATRDSFRKCDSTQLKNIGKVFSDFYRQQILTNKNNVLGRYIYQSYGIHLTEADDELVKAQLVND